MGVVRDVTVDNLVTAVGNIDTSSLAQDSTLQDVVTAIGNISGGSDPVTNTTVNSLCKDTTGQSIATAINSLAGAISPAASNVTFNNTGTGLSASNVQGLGVEINNKINGLIKKSSVSLTFDTSGRTTIQLNMGRIIAIDFQTTNYTYTLRYLSATQTLIYLRRADTLALITNDSNPIDAVIYYI